MEAGTFSNTAKGKLRHGSFDFRPKVANSHAHTMGLIFSFPPDLKLKSMTKN